MKIAVIGGAGAMGGIFGGLLARAGHEVTLVDVSSQAVSAINEHGLVLEDSTGVPATIAVRATTDPASVGHVDLALVFVKCYHTEGAVQNAAPLFAPDTVVLSLQNGWGNAPRIAGIVGQERVMVGVTYHSGTLLAPGLVRHAGRGTTFIGEISGAKSERIERIAAAFTAAGLDVVVSEAILNEIWSKLALNVCTLPTAALLRFYAGQLAEHDGTLELMRALLCEVVAVARAQGIVLDEQERWDAIVGVLRRAKGAKPSMLQDVEGRRRTEIDVISGAIVEAGRRFGVATPYNQAMVWLVKALEETF